MRKYIPFILYIVQLVVVVLVLLGILPRSTMLGLTGLIVLMILGSPIRAGIIFFVLSIPLFLALPITASFDNFNAWRIVLAVLFLKWLIQERREIMASTIQAIRHPLRYIQQHPAIAGLLLLLLLALISLSGAGDLAAGAKRIIYFANIAILGIIIYQQVRKFPQLREWLIRTIRIPAMIVIVVGFLQVLSTYLMDIYQFMRLWGEGIQCAEFGSQWCTIAVRVGNTWFAYYGEQLSLRVFSLFPDSHSFPIFVLLSIPALMTIKQKWRRRIWVTAALLIAILSGTRGIWAASIGVVALAIGAYYLLVRQRAPTEDRVVLRRIARYLIVFFLLFGIAYPIFTSPQFLVSKGNFGLFRNRIKSIIDFGETSNSQRIEIWKKSLVSIREHPLTGVGIGNFPVVLGQDIALSRAGSSAHNIYLHIAAEMGIAALLLVLYLVVELMRKIYRTYRAANTPLSKTYAGGLLLFVPWVLIYSLTDVALFDERAFLLFVATIGLIAAFDE